MNDEKFWSASTKELAQGYLHNQEAGCFHCLVCGHETERGVVYPFGNRLLDAERAIIEHVAEVHGGMLPVLLGLGKAVTGLSDSQAEVLKRLHVGMTDQEIAAELKLTTSTIRSYRFKFREKERQARVYMAMMGLLGSEKDTRVPIHRGATMIDDRYDITAEERDQVLSRYFDPQGRLIDFPRRQKRKIIILSALSRNFSPGRRYSEKEVNRILQRIYDDYVTLRRYLIEYGYMDRNTDGSQYWLKS